jgi:hypothetical protein
MRPKVLRWDQLRGHPPLNQEVLVEARGKARLHEFGRMPPEIFHLV